jgi:hypothetical protein
VENREKTKGPGNFLLKTPPDLSLKREDNHMVE